MKDASVWFSLQVLAGDFTADNFEDNMMRNYPDDGSVATSAIEFRWASDSEDFD